MQLGFSRAMFACFVDRRSLQAFMDSHIASFNYLGGVPVELLYRIRRVARTPYGNNNLNHIDASFRRRLQFPKQNESIDKIRVSEGMSVDPKNICCKSVIYL